ncbi:hypothetical protein QQF64_011766, partial [Cirrhinus molitorella]
MCRKGLDLDAGVYVTSGNMFVVQYSDAREREREREKERERAQIVPEFQQASHIDKLCYILGEKEKCILLAAQTAYLTAQRSSKSQREKRGMGHSECARVCAHLAETAPSGPSASSVWSPACAATEQSYQPQAHNFPSGCRPEPSPRTWLYQNHRCSLALQGACVCALSSTPKSSTDKETRQNDCGKKLTFPNSHVLLHAPLNEMKSHLLLFLK